MTTWFILTGEYPPQPGGVGDYSRLLAEGLANAGDEVHVWTPGAAQAERPSTSLSIHGLPDRFGRRSRSALGTALRTNPDVLVLVQYVPQAFGLRGMNLPFAHWIWQQRQYRIWIMFHEVAFPFESAKPTLLLLAIITHIMARTLRRAADRIFVSIPAWMDLLAIPHTDRAKVHWLPVPSNVPVIDDGAATRAIRARLGGTERLVIGHFGTFSGAVWELLHPAITAILREGAGHTMLLMGRNGTSARESLLRANPNFADRVFATGELPAHELSVHLQTCDFALQPYPDGVSTRRGTVMAMLAHGVPVITSRGRLTESLWWESGAVALAPPDDATALPSAAKRLSEDRSARLALGAAGKALYETHFDISRTVESLRRCATE